MDKNLFIVGIGLILAGFTITIVILLVLRVISRRKVVLPDSPESMASSTISASDDAVLMIQTGGKVLYANQIAQEWFEHYESTPNLERLARLTRPSEVFLSLCTTEGQARFSLNGRLVECNSYWLPKGNSNGSGIAFGNNDGRVMLMTLRQPQLSAVGQGKAGLSEHTLEIFAGIGQEMASSLDLEKTLQAILEGVDRLIPSDFLEISIWDSTNKNLIPYQLAGLPEIDRRLERILGDHSPKNKFTGELLKQRTPVLISDADAMRENFAPSRGHPVFNSYLGAPLQSAGELIGTLELASLNNHVFTSNDLEILRFLSGQAAIALKNALLFQEEQKRVLELSGLARLAQAVGTLSDTQELFEWLIDGISPMFDVRFLGFLVYQEGQRVIEAQKPFVGIPAPMLDLYHVELPPGTPAEELFLSEKIIQAANASEDQNLAILGLNHMAIAAGMQDTILIPLTAAGIQLGYLQAADKKDGLPFTQDDIRLLTIIASQSAAIIQNAILLKESHERAQRSDAMRRIASLAASVATLDEILSFSLLELARLMKADIALAFLLNENTGELQAHARSFYGISDNMAPDLSKIAISDPQFRSDILLCHSPFIFDDTREDASVDPVYKNISNLLGVSSLVGVPLVVRNQGVGELLLGKQAARFFTRSDLTLIATASSQISSALEKTSLLTQTDESLQRRVVQLLALMRVSRELSTTLSQERLLRLVFDEALQATRADCGWIALFDLEAGKTSPPVILQHIGDGESLSIISTLEQQVIDTGEPVLIENFAEEGKVSAESYLPPHVGVRTSLIVPIAYLGSISGLIHLHARASGQFDQTAVEVAQSLAVQAAIALGNAQRFQEQRRQTEILSRRSNTMTAFLKTSQVLRDQLVSGDAYEAIANGISSAVPFSVVTVSQIDSKEDALILRAAVGLPQEKFSEMKKQPESWLKYQELILPEYRLGLVYFVPGDGIPYSPPDSHPEAQDANEGSVEMGGGWLTDDLVFIPIMNDQGDPLGLIQLNEPRDKRRPDRLTLESLELFASQASLLIQTQAQAKHLKGEVETYKQDTLRSSSALKNAQISLPALLHNDLSRVLSIRQLNQRVRWITAGLDIIDVVNNQTNRSDVLRVLGQELLIRLGVDIVLVAEPGEGSLRLIYALGRLPTTTTPQALLGQRNPLRASLATGDFIYVANLDESTEWKNSPLLISLEAKSFISFPILGKGERTGSGAVDRADAVVMVASHLPIAFLAEEDLHLFSLLSHQVGDALDDLRMVEEMNHRLQEVNLLLEFSRQLGTLDAVSILRNLVESALQVIPSAVAGMVALWSDRLNCLVPQYASGYVNNQKIMQINYRSGVALPGQAFEQKRALRVDEVDFAQNYNLPSESLLLYRDATEGKLPVSNLIIPLQAQDVQLGVLVLDNFKIPAAFTESDQALVTSLARQTALTLENARLYQDAQERSAQLQALTNVAGIITSSLQVSDLIGTLLDQAQSVIPYDTGTLWLRVEDVLTVRAARGFENIEERIGLSVAFEDSLLLKEMINTSLPISVGDVRQDERFPALVENQYLSWLGVPLLSQGQVIGVIALEKLEPFFYTPEHIQAMVTFSGQAAVALENAHLYEESVQRALELDQRSNRLALLNRVSSDLSSSLDQDTILKVIIKELPRAIRCDLVSIALIKPDGTAWIEAMGPEKTIDLPYQLPPNPMIDRLRDSLGVLSFEDTRHEPELELLHDFLAATGMASLLVLPLATGSNLSGLVLAHTVLPYRFALEEVELARTICNQAAVSIQNARLYTETELLFAETQQRSAELSSLFDLGVSLTQVRDEDRLLDVIFTNVSRLVKCEAVVVALVDDKGYLTAHIQEHGVRQEPVIALRKGNSFSEYVIETNRPLLIPDTQIKTDLPVAGVRSGDPCRTWLGVPLTMRGKPTGVISVQSYSPNAFSETEVRLLGQVANQLSVSMDNAQLFMKVQTYAEDLEDRVDERTEQLAKEHKRSQTLLNIITELSASLDLDVVLNRTLTVINESVTAEHSLILLVEPDGATLFLRASIGYSMPLPRGGQPSVIKSNEGLAGWIIQNRQPVLVDDLWLDNRWLKRKDRTQTYRSAMAVPLIVGEDTLGVMMLFHRHPDHFSADQLDLIQATAKQISVAINNAQLYSLIRDQAERLGDMLRIQHVENSRSNAILESVADGVLVTDQNRQITLFNMSAGRILGLSQEDVVGHSLDHFMGLFGRAGQSWLEAIRTWSEDPQAYKPGDAFSVQILLENNRVVAVSMTPVRMRNEFLGTVSIFRDITHEVEVDQLKSEFVATVSHELRTPMTSIKGYVDILLMGAAGELKPQQSQYLEVVKSNTERLAVLVNDLLDISRIEAGKVTLSLLPLELGTIIQDAITAFERRAEQDAKAMQFERVVSESIPLVRGDPERVRQIIDGLIENAYHYTHEGGRILVRATLVGEEVQVDVKDTGIGISLDGRERIFERFYRGEDPLVLATSGTGLGLSIVKTLVEMHQGRIWFESSGVSGEGSTFSFTLPIFIPGEGS